MLANVLGRFLYRTGTSIVASSLKVTSSQTNNLILNDQVRYFRKQPRFRYRYGIQPTLQEDDFMKLEQEGELEKLSYQKVRFATIWENNSPLYDKEFEKFMRFLLRQGKLELFYHLMHKTFYQIKIIQLKKKNKLAGKGQPTDDIELNPMIIFKQALENAKPLVTAKRVKRGGAIYQVPFPLTEQQSYYIGMKWIQSAVLQRARPRKRKFFESMSQELLDAFHNEGKVIKKRDDIHRLADANRAYSHYRWN